MKAGKGFRFEMQSGTRTHTNCSRYNWSAIDLFAVLTEDVLSRWLRNLWGYRIPHTFDMISLSGTLNLCSYLRSRQTAFCASWNPPLLDDSDLRFLPSYQYASHSWAAPVRQVLDSAFATVHPAQHTPRRCYRRSL
jgi:hypothetical protein